MDPIALSYGLLNLSASLAIIVNVALSTPSGRRILDSNLKELPVLFSLVEEMQSGILASQTTIPGSAALAFAACQTDRDRLVECLSQRGLMGFGQSNHSFSELQKQLSDKDMESKAQKTLFERSVAISKNKMAKRHSFKEMLHLFDYDTLDKRVKSFKSSVLLLRHIAMDFQTHNFLQTQFTEQQGIISELHDIRSLLKISRAETRHAHDRANTNEPEEIQSTAPIERTTESDEMDLFRRQLPNQQSANSTFTTLSQHGPISQKPIPQRHPSQQGSLSLKTNSTRFDIIIAIPGDIDPETHKPKSLSTIFAKARLDTGNDANMISIRYISEHGLQSLMTRLVKTLEFTLGDGKGKMSSDATIKLTWFNTHDSMKTYTTLFHVVESKSFDVLLGEPFYNEHGALSKDVAQEMMMMGVFKQIHRSGEIRKKEKIAAKVAEEEARRDLRHETESLTEDMSAPIPARTQILSSNHLMQSSPLQSHTGSVSPQNSRHPSAEATISPPPMLVQEHRTSTDIDSPAPVDEIIQHSDLSPISEVSSEPHRSISELQLQQSPDVSSPLPRPELMRSNNGLKPSDDSLTVGDLPGGSITSRESTDNASRDGAMGTSRASTSSSQSDKHSCLSPDTAQPSSNEKTALVNQGNKISHEVQSGTR